MLIDRIKISNQEKPKITYSLSSRELIINISAIAKTNNKKETPPSTPVVTTPTVTAPPKTKNKVIVLDAGHGGEDAGAVGPNKRYEKVINLNVSKNLYSILKQRGYKVYLT